MFLLGIDIGYSNLKIAYGDSALRDPKVEVFPSGAAPMDAVGPRFNGERRATVLVEGRPWIAGEPQAGLLRPSQRGLDDNFPATDYYRALLNYALLRAGREHVDHLVTGLPVGDSLKPERVGALKERLTSFGARSARHA